MNNEWQPAHALTSHTQLMQRYRLTKPLGDGTYGSVSAGVSLDTGERVAVKRMKRKYASWDEAVNMREVRSLRRLHHPHIVTLREVVREADGELCLVFEAMEGNLFELLREKGTRFDEGAVRSIMGQALSGLAFMHKSGFFHRDLKPENLLVRGDTVKLADFGLAREVRSAPPYTDYVATRWYRAPECLLRAPVYSSPVDTWAMGAIMAELLSTRPLFPGTSEPDQLMKLCAVLGTPTARSWSEGLALAARLGLRLPQLPPTPLASLLPHASPEAVHLIGQMLQWDPSRRPSASAALQHPFFARHMPIPGVLGLGQGEGAIATGVGSSGVSAAEQTVLVGPAAPSARAGSPDASECAPRLRGAATLPLPMAIPSASAGQVSASSARVSTQAACGLAVSSSAHPASVPWQQHVDDGNVDDDLTEALLAALERPSGKRQRSETVPAMSGPKARSALATAALGARAHSPIVPPSATGAGVSSANSLLQETPGGIGRSLGLQRGPTSTLDRASATGGSRSSAAPITRAVEPASSFRAGASAGAFADEFDIDSLIAELDPTENSRGLSAPVPALASIPQYQQHRGHALYAPSHSLNSHFVSSTRASPATAPRLTFFDEGGALSAARRAMADPYGQGQQQNSQKSAFNGASLAPGPRDSSATRGSASSLQSGVALSSGGNNYQQRFAAASSVPDPWLASPTPVIPAQPTSPHVTSWRPLELPASASGAGGGVPSWAQQFASLADTSKSSQRGSFQGISTDGGMSGLAALSQAGLLPGEPRQPPEGGMAVTAESTRAPYTAPMPSGLATSVGPTAAVPQKRGFFQFLFGGGSSGNYAAAAEAALGPDARPTLPPPYASSTDFLSRFPAAGPRPGARGRAGTYASTYATSADASS